MQVVGARPDGRVGIILDDHLWIVNVEEGTVSRPLSPASASRFRWPRLVSGDNLVAAVELIEEAQERNGFEADALVAVYNPEQKRCPTGTPFGGRWVGADGDCGGGTTPSGSPVNYSPPARTVGWTPDQPFPEPMVEGAISAAADELYERASQSQGAVQSTILDIAEATGADMLGLDFQQKGRDSLLRKMRDRMMGRNLTVLESQQAITDSLRYTFSWDANEYTDGVADTILTLENDGWTLHEPIDDYWQDNDDDYNGVNSVWRTPDGVAVEIQFHTPESFDIKNENHGRYEQFRVSNDPDEQLRLWDEMVEPWQAAPRPGGWPPAIEEAKLRRRRKAGPRG
jgi:hypothetical protein